MSTSNYNLYSLGGEGEDFKLIASQFALAVESLAKTLPGGERQPLASPRSASLVEVESQPLAKTLPGGEGQPLAKTLPGGEGQPLAKTLPGGEGQPLASPRSASLVEAESQPLASPLPARERQSVTSPRSASLVEVERQSVTESCIDATTVTVTELQPQQPQPQETVDTSAPTEPPPPPQKKRKYTKSAWKKTSTPEKTLTMEEIYDSFEFFGRIIRQRDEHWVNEIRRLEDQIHYLRYKVKKYRLAATTNNASGVSSNTELIQIMYNNKTYWMDEKSKIVFDDNIYRVGLYEKNVIVFDYDEDDCKNL